MSSLPKASPKCMASCVHQKVVHWSIFAGLHFEALSSSSRDNVPMYAHMHTIEYIHCRLRVASTDFVVGLATYQIHYNVICATKSASKRQRDACVDAVGDPLLFEVFN